MRWQVRWGAALVALMVVNAGLHGQGQQPANAPQPKQPMPPPAANVIAAMVNGQPIPEIAVFRAAQPKDRASYELIRQDILEHLIDNLLIDQYLIQLKVNIENKEIDEKMAIVKVEADKEGGLDKLLKVNHVTEAELRKELASMLRWERFVVQQSTDKTLKDFFAQNVAMFDGSQVHARHILLKPGAGLTKEQATSKLQQLKKGIEEETQRQWTKLPAADRTEKRSADILDKVFAEVAQKESACPSKENGGNLPWFQRAGMMVEPFARAAFELRPFQISDIVTTKFGQHLILAIDRKPGREVKFDDVKRSVREVYSERLSEAVLAAMKPNANIVVHPPAK